MGKVDGSRHIPVNVWTVAHNHSNGDSVAAVKKLRGGKARSFTPYYVMMMAHDKCLL